MNGKLLKLRSPAKPGGGQLRCARIDGRVGEANSWDLVIFVCL
ncbi:hypothetical protein ACSCB1_19170 [Streptomyces europaeiscabiei]|uniref:Uncharacterized protein n=1 Tax=Streptomyces europaeiscabiei TaxID=146819 RepID=A0ABU4NNB3_9ACTN|nr:hypothetical protein [Streptomyces europaeiscabiei]MDX2522938.1 hypothetical protein [Streptomyces europaeiscabiei]MDX2764530.1 hypothetical protein [Streptomyces europaeiscabiei]MDX3547166.1 hypothetical protein [Streptomyces europaeiscabiei]MDX3556913.1 hypothetical protein [Streptomyces europaeiscabiei]MDX3704575.1 hypothetical protein [Streptomyces europaeiscabiei]